MTVETFYPHRGDHDSLARARAVCATCPVTVECRDYALKASLKQGIWGGLSERQRRTYAHQQRQEKTVSSDPIPANFDDDEVRPFGLSWPDDRAVEVCEHLIAGIERDVEALQVGYSCVLCPRPLLCKTCFEMHLFGHVVAERMCAVCGAPDPEVARCDLPAPSMFAYLVSLEEAVLSVFVGGIQSVAFLCEAHGGAKHWTLNTMIDVLGRLDD